MVTGLRVVTDARGRRFGDARLDEAWQTLDCGFAAVADVFAECFGDAAATLDTAQLADYVDTARFFGKLGRGAEPVLAFLEHWPAVVNVVGSTASGAVHSALMQTVQAIQRSPNSKALVPLLASLAPVARRLPSAQQMARYLALVVDMMTRTSGSIHGRQTTLPSPGLPALLGKAPELLAQVSLAGFANWIDTGVRSHGNHPERQIEYFSLASPDSRAVLLRERHGTLFADAERALDATLRALWQESDPLVPYSTLLIDDEQGAQAASLLPHIDVDGLRVPDVLDDCAGVAAIDRYRLMLAHMIGHRRWSTPQIADNWSPQQRLAVETFEDCRIDTLLMRRYPGLRRMVLALHPVPTADACDDERVSCLRHRLTMVSRALLDERHGYAHPEIEAAAQAFRTALAAGESSTAAMATLALAFVTRTRRQSDQFAQVHFTDTVVDYRDDNRHLWRFIEAGDEEEVFDARETRHEAAEPAGLPPRRYREWDYLSQTYRPDWASVYEALHPSGDAADIDRLLARHAVLARRLKRVLDVMKPQDRVRERFREEGSELDLDVALRSLIDFRAGVTPDPRINLSHRTDGRDVAVLLLLDLSESLNAPLPGGDGQTVLQLSQEAVALAAWAIDCLGDPCAIAGFHSNTRHDVRYVHIKGFSERWEAPAKSRLAALRAGWSTRMGAALRHGGHYLGARRADKRILLLLTDGEPSDIDVDDAAYLRSDARRAVAELSAQGITTFCLSLDAQADAYVSEIFGRHWRVLDRIERLPEQLPLVYLSLTKR